MQNIKDVVLKYALQNAVNYDGKANAGAVIGKVFAEFKDIKDKSSLAKQVQEVIKQVNSMSFQAQRSKLESLAPELLEKKKVVETRKLHELENASPGKVIMRLAPYPSGSLHIGNARMVILNDEYVKKYKGRLLLIIDDTIGSEEKTISKEAYKLIPSSLEWLQVKYQKPIIKKSDRLKIYYKYAEELIKKDKSYVCSCKSEVLRDNRATGKECSCRSQDTNKNLELWKKMFKSKEGSYTLRLKTDMQHPNPAFRDRVLFRIVQRKHPLIGSKYRIWPLLEFSWAIDDYLLGITHVLRGKDLMIESEVEKFIWDLFGWKHPVLIHHGLLQIEGTKLSKSKSKKEVESGLYFGWDDPRTWSLQSLERRGFKPEAIRNFILNLGLNPTEATVSVDALYAENRKLIDKECNRYFFVQDPKKIKITNAPKIEAKAPLHPDFPNRGSRILKTSDEFYIEDNLEKDKNYRFMHLFNFKSNEFISQELDQGLNAKLIHWLPVSKDLVNVEILMPSGDLIKGLGESSLKKLKVNNVIQFERHAFCRLDKREKDKLVFWYTHR